ncbi:hypothetical protein I352_06605 [Cryptococcus deuterogattii MMRL2647]|nr:hypothetical protein I352_06605 [Cryptococcus deuterogattii MMRL2647]
MSEDDENRNANGDGESEDELEKGEYSNYKTVRDEEDSEQGEEDSAMVLLPLRLEDREREQEDTAKRR